MEDITILCYADVVVMSQELAHCPPSQHIRGHCVPEVLSFGLGADLTICGHKRSWEYFFNNLV